MARHAINALLTQPVTSVADDPTSWSNKQAMLYARRMGWNHKDRKMLLAKALELGLDVKPQTVPAALIRSIAATLQAHGGL